MKCKIKKPEVSYDRVSETFICDRKPITEDEARSHWNAIDADWTIGAYNEMMRRVMA